MQYKIVYHHDPAALSKEVEELLNDGWELHGNLAVATTETSDIYAQALTNERDPEPDFEVELPSLTSEEIVKRLQEMASVPEDQQTEEFRQRKAKIAQILSGALSRVAKDKLRERIKNSEIDPE